MSSILAFQHKSLGESNLFLIIIVTPEMLHALKFVIYIRDTRKGKLNAENNFSS